MKAPYHHGDLRTALLRAAEDELIDGGVEKFSLRACARRAGVSHAAPTHHFQNADGLLAELAIVGFERLLQAMKTEMAEQAQPRERLLAAGCGYVMFAVENPALFKLMFSSDRAKAPPEKSGPARAAYETLQLSVKAYAGDKPPEAIEFDIAAAWSIVHGLAHLMIEGAPLFSEQLRQDRRAAVAAVISRVLSPAR